MIDLKVKIGQKFHLRDIDLDKLEKAATKEFNSKKLSSYENTYNGLAAEHYMMEHHDYINNLEDYQDVFSPCFTPVEIKSRVSVPYIHDALEELSERKEWKKPDGTLYAKVPEYVIAFLRKGEEYMCHSFWTWNKENKKFECVERADNNNVQLDAFMV